MSRFPCAGRLPRVSLAGFLGFALAAPLAYAQTNVTLYGRVDLGVQVQSRSTVKDSMYSSLHSGGIRPSIWGLRGTEELGDGLKASFNLEGQLDASTGGILTQPNVPNQVFRRQANVGLSGAWGTVQFGRMYSPLIFGTIGVEPRAWREQFSQLGHLAYNNLASPGDTLGAGSNISNDIGVFIGNAVQYSHNIGPFYVGIAYSLGEQSSSSQGSQISAGASYTGPVTVGFGYSKVNDSRSGVSVNDTWDLGMAVPLGGFTARVNYMKLTNRNYLNGAKVSDVDSWGAGLDYKTSEANTIGASAYLGRYDGSGAGKSSSKALVLSDEYALSKRTILYAQFAYEDAGAVVNAADGLEYLKRTIVIGATAPPGKKTSLVSVGISHNF